MGCSDLCTAAKCAELETRINQLERAFQELEADFALHLSQDIPEAHGLMNEASEPEPTEDPEVSVDVSARGDGNFLIRVAVGDKSDADGFTVDIPEIPEPVEPVEPEVSVSVSETGEDQYSVSVSVGTKQDEDSFTITHPDIPDNNDNNQHVKSNLQGSASFNNGTLTININDGESADTFSTFIPTNESPQTIFITEEVFMNCDQLENKFDDCCGQIIGALNNLSNELINTANGINTEVNKVYEQVTVDISGTLNSDYACEFPTDESENIIPTYAESIVVEKSYSGQGLAGIHENLKLVNANLDKLHADVCKAVDPISTITLDDLYKHCLSNDIERSSFEIGEQGDADYQDAQEAYLLQLLSESKYGYLLDGAVDGELVTAPNNWTHQILTDFALIQSRINNTAICAIEPAEQNDVVSIVASDKAIHRVTGLVLILHFVTFDNYPKRNSSSGYRPIQIPAAKDEYDWVNDFESLRWHQGNQYGELQFNEPYVPVSGWFKDKATANAYFDAILTLTNATEDNRVFPNHSNPKTAIPERETRPYRAFIKSVNVQGQAVCHGVYKPILSD